MITFEEFSQVRNSENFTKRFVKAAEGYADLMQVGVVDDHQVFKVVINPDGKRTVAFVAGLHGNEPGGPEGVVKFLEEHPYVPSSKKVVIIPLLNPTGYVTNQRRNDDNKDINRQFFKKPLSGEAKIAWDALKDEDLDLFHSLHEDPRFSEFYLYYSHDKKLAQEILELAKKYFKIMGKDKNGTELLRDKLIDGLIPLPHEKSGTIEDLMLEYGVPYFTSETPGLVPLVRRAKFTKEMMKLVIHSF